MVILMVMVYYCKRIQIKSAKEKGIRIKVWEKLGTSFRVLPPSSHTRMHLILPAMMLDNTCKTVPTMEAHPTLESRIFAGV